jgi:ABC-2 type transport system ATP-binding protein
MIEATNLRKQYGDVVALDGLSFDVPGGTIFGLLGPNGAGKSTAVKVLTTLARADAGRRASPASTSPARPPPCGARSGSSRRSRASTST